MKRGEEADDEVSFLEMGMGWEIIMETRAKEKNGAAQKIFVLTHAVSGSERCL